MSLTRRQFLLSVPGVVAGFILPSYLARATEFLAKTGSPLLVAPRKSHCVLTALDDGSGSYQMNIGDPFIEPPRYTLREYIDQYYWWGDHNDYMEENGLTSEEFRAALDKEVDLMLYFDEWVRRESPIRLAYDYLSSLELGHELESENSLGSIEFIDGCCPGNDYIAAHAVDDMSLSLLQERLNQLNEGVRIEIRTL